MKHVTIHEAKTHLSRLVAEVEAGGEVILSRGKVPVARIVPLAEAKPRKRQLGWLAHTLPPGKDPLEDGFWDRLPDEYLGAGSSDTDPLNKGSGAGDAAAA